MTCSVFPLGITGFARTVCRHSADTEINGDNMSQRRTSTNRTILGSIAVVGVAAALVLTGQATAQAAAGDVICEVRRGDSLAMRVTDNGDRTFHVSLVEGSLQAQPAMDESRFVPLPTEPVDLRNSRAVISLAAGVAVVPGSIVLSQGVRTIVPEDESAPYGYELEGAEAPSTDEGTVSPDGASISWIASTDIRENPTDGRSVPADFEEAPWLAIDASTSVIEFDLAPAGDVTPGTDLPAVLGSIVDLNRALFSPFEETYEFSEDDSTARELDGCVIPASFLVVPTVTPTSAAPTTATQTASAALANTGTDAVAPLWIAGAVLALGVGSAFGAAARRRRTAA